MKKHLLKTILLLFALVAGTSSLWAQTVTLWTEDWSGTTSSQTPSTCTITGYSDITYSYTNGGGTTQTYKKSSFTDPELLIAKNNGTFTVTIPASRLTGLNSTLNLQFDCNKNLTLTVTNGTLGSKSTSSSTYTYPITVKDNTKALVIEFKNTLTSNSRFSNASLTGTAVAPAYTITAQSNKVEYGTVSIDGMKITGSPKEGCRYATPAYTVTSGTAAVSQNGNTFTVTPSSDCAITINFEAIPALSSIAITTAPTKTTYNEGETFDATGMVVTATFDDASTEDVTADCTFDPSGVLTTSDTEVTVSYTRNAVTKTATQAITVNTYVQPTEFDIALNNTLFGTSYSGTAAGITDDTPVEGTQDNVTVTYAGSGNHYINDSQIRFYPNNKLTFKAPSGYNITKIVFTSAGTWAATISANSGTYTSGTKTWTGEATSVVFTGSGSSRCEMSEVAITLAVPSSVPTPTFTVTEGIYSEAQNVKVSNYNKDYMYFYTTDGTAPDCDSELTPTGTSQVYDHATGIDISATTTLKIIAADIEGNKSSVATAAYTIQLPFTTIADVKALASGTSFKLNLTGAQVVYIDDAKKNIYVRDASGAIVLFNSSGFSTSLTTGDILSGIVEGKYQPYNGLPEVVNSDISGLSKTGNSTVVAKTIAGTTEAIAANLCDLVKIENTEISERDSKYYVGTSSDIQLYNQFKIGGSVNALTFTTGQPVDVSGIATVYNTTYELFPRFESDIVYLSSAEEVAIGAAGIATFCSEHPLDFTGTDAIAVYTAAASGDHVTLTQIHKVPANTGVILMNALGMNEGAVAAVNVPYLDGDADNVSDNELVGITTATVVNAMSADKYNYILSNEDAGVGFYRAVDGVQLAANKAYLSTTVNAAVRGFLGFTEDDSDAIIEIAKNEKMSAIFDLSGRRVVKPTKGLYIVNGKKVVK